MGYGLCVFPFALFHYYLYKNICNYPTPYSKGGFTVILDDSNSFVLPRNIFTKTKSLKENNFKIFLFFNYIYYVAYTNHLNGIKINKILLKKLNEYFEFFSLNGIGYINNKNLIVYVIEKHSNINIINHDDDYFEFEVKDFNSHHIRFPDFLANPDTVKLLKNIINFNFRTSADRLIIIYKLLEILYDNNKNWDLNNKISNNLDIQLRERIKSFNFHHSKNAIQQLLNKNFLRKDKSDYYINYPFIVPDYKDKLAGKATEHIWLLVHKYPGRDINKLKEEKLDLYKLIRELSCKMYNNRPFLYLNKFILNNFVNIYTSYPEDDKSIKTEKLLSSIKCYDNIIKQLKTGKNDKGAVSKKFNITIPAKNDFSYKIMDLIKKSYPLTRDLTEIKPGLPHYEISNDTIDYFIEIVKNKDSFPEEKKNYFINILDKLRNNQPFIEHYLKKFPGKLHRQIIDYSTEKSQLNSAVIIKPYEGGYEITFPGITDPSDIDFFEKLGATVINGNVIKILPYDIVELTKVFARKSNTASQYRNYYFFRELFNDACEESFIWYEIESKQKIKNKLNILAAKNNKPVIAELYNLIKGPFLNKDELKEKLYEYITDEEDIKHILTITSHKSSIIMAETAGSWFIDNDSLCYSGKNLFEKVRKKIYKYICKLRIKPFDVYFLIEVNNKNKVLPDNTAIKFKFNPFDVINGYGHNLENGNNCLVFKNYSKDVTDRELIDFISLDYRKLEESVETEIKLIPSRTVNINNLLREVNKNLTIQFRFFINYCKKPS